MNGGIVQPSTATVTSVRGNETFTTPSDDSALSAPVAAATAFSSIGGESLGGAGFAGTGTGATAGAETVVSDRGGRRRCRGGGRHGLRGAASAGEDRETQKLPAATQGARDMR